MKKKLKLIAFTLFFSSQTIAYELPVGSGVGHTDACNKYTNKKTELFIKERGLKFRPYELRSGNKIIKDKDWNETNFRTSMSAACAISSMQAERVNETTAINNGLSFYNTMYQSTNGDVSGEDIVELIKGSVIFGRSIK